jgi:hypothetical protein
MLVTLSFARESATSFAVPTVQGPGGTKPVKASRNDRTKGDRCQPDTSAIVRLLGVRRPGAALFRSYATEAKAAPGRRTPRRRTIQTETTT